MKDELDKFKTEMAEHKNDFNSVLDQLRTDAVKTIELRQSTEQQAHAELQKKAAEPRQILSNRTAESAQKILEYKLLDDRRMETL